MPKISKVFLNTANRGETAGPDIPECAEWTQWQCFNTKAIKLTIQNYPWINLKVKYVQR